mmetsp:Transcript_28332/g.77784  ORF Transcript_28332/g.77784 Transcript_28332/m.77784 type:complete len:227 (-) Transcript_28332:468-1148(-)
MSKFSLASYREGMIGSGIVTIFRSLGEDIYSASSWFNDATCEEKTIPLPAGSKKCCLRKTAVSSPMQSWSIFSSSMKRMHLWFPSQSITHSLSTLVTPENFKKPAISLGCFRLFKAAKAILTQSSPVGSIGRFSEREVSVLKLMYTIPCEESWLRTSFASSIMDRVFPPRLHRISAIGLTRGLFVSSRFACSNTFLAELLNQFFGARNGSALSFSKTTGSLVSRGL